jgi:predicted thioesterase
MFDVEASDEVEKVGEGRHERFIINVPKFRAKFGEKQKKLGL